MPITQSQVFAGRENSFTANNNVLNLNSPIYSFYFISDGNSDLVQDANGNLLLEANGGGTDPNTSIVFVDSLGNPTGTYRFIVESIGTLPSGAADNGNKVPASAEGTTVAKIQIVGFPTQLKLAFAPDGSISAATWAGFGTGNITLGNQNTDPEFVCFAAGTLIDTPEGPRAVESLQPGDRVVVSTGESLPILWCGASELTWPGSPENLRPYAVAQGALTNGLPRRDLVVSPQHKVLMSGPEVNALFGVPEVLAPVKGLAALPGVRLMRGKKTVTYHHILLERHEVIFSEGAPTESFYPGTTASQMLGKEQMAAIERLFPGVSEDPQNFYGPQARLCLTRRQTEALVEHSGALVPS